MKVTLGRLADLKVVGAAPVVSTGGLQIEIEQTVDDANGRDLLTLQLQGLAEAGIVPVVFDDAPLLSGFYAVDAAVSPGPGTGYTVAASVQLTRTVRAVASPLIEQTVVSSVRPNDYGKVAADTRTSVFAPASASWTGGGVDPQASITFPTADGDLVEWPRDTFEGRWVAQHIHPSSADFYTGAALIEWRPSAISTVWYPVTGHALPPTSSAAQVRISNGRTRLTPTTDGHLLVEGYTAPAPPATDPAAPWDWWTGPEFQVEVAGYVWNAGPNESSGVLTDAPPIILRNDPETATIRMFADLGFTLDLTVHRGIRMVECQATASPELTSTTIDILLPQAVTWSSGVASIGGYDGGNPEQGWWVALADTATLTSTKASRSGDSFQFAFGTDVDDVTNNGLDEHAVANYYAALSTSQTVVS